MNSKIRSAQMFKVPYMIVLGENEKLNDQISVRVRNGTQKNNISLAEFVAELNQKIKTRSSEL